ncbi:CRISPR-associated helicase Cas3' [Evtepia sp.]|uniref:CRISPR-associated helicase Cas3' n=1 Tax=Evtepia sp. TaxID=2773933 RepID=UPI002A83C4C4|nr:CRISPR-associated helicase Cas3' [Evtepia sp.]MDY4430609.1 CRISPR-associated helicase Cas3' [Evtepia sp.]
MKYQKYYAKSKRSDGTQVTVKEHLSAVSEYAAKYGVAAGIDAEARLAGLFHDFGKYSDSFQDVLLGLRRNIDHAACGAALLYQVSKARMTGPIRSVIEAVNGHHDGLLDNGALYGLLRESLGGNALVSVNDGKACALTGPEEYKRAFDLFRAEHPTVDFKLPRWILPKEKSGDNLATMLYTRMLFSCLVDADYTVSAWEETSSCPDTPDEEPLLANTCLERLYEHRNMIRKSSQAESVLNGIRDQVFEQCGICGEQEGEGLFTLTAPTGTGKTLALLHFALRHCLATGKKRIIIVLPFLTLAEQNTAVYEKIMPSVLVDHSQSRLSDDAREIASKWSAPFIITTSVKFFETLFAHRPSDCRKLHSLAQSVVIFDEAQSLPPHLTGTTLRAVNELCERYHMTMVFSTATQPSFQGLPGMTWNPREIVPEYANLYRQLERVRVDWRLQKDGDIPLQTIAEELQTYDSVCGIFNIRRHAREVFDRIYQEEPESTFLLSTDLCPAHRSRVVEEIRQRLSECRPCRVISTQCIEAGVDLDFPVLYRALAPLDSIIQAAGRCNRNGTQDFGRVVVFEPEDRVKYPEDTYQNAAVLVKRMVMEGDVNINDPRDIDRYYTALFADARDDDKLIEAIGKRDFAEVDRRYRLIPESGEKLIVPYSGMGEEYERLLEKLHTGMTHGLMKEAAPLTVTIYHEKDLEIFAEPILTKRTRYRDAAPSGYWVLRAQYRHLYTDWGGLRLPEECCKGDGFLY